MTWEALPILPLFYIKYLYYLVILIQIMKKAVIGGDFEKRHALPSYTEGKKALARKRMVCMLVTLSPLLPAMFPHFELLFCKMCEV